MQIDKTNDFNLDIPNGTMPIVEMVSYSSIHVSITNSA